MLSHSGGSRLGEAEPRPNQVGANRCGLRASRSCILLCQPGENNGRTLAECGSSKEAVGIVERIQTPGKNIKVLDAHGNVLIVLDEELQTNGREEISPQ